MTKSFSKTVPMNLVTNMGVFVLNIVINIFMTPFYIKYVGIDGLGVIRLALLLPVYVNLATLVISGAVSRFLTIDLQEKNYDNANITFNTSFFSISTILIVAVPLIVYFALNVTSFLNIPGSQSEESVYLLLGIFLSSQITIFSTLFLIPAYANNRLDIQNYIKIITLFIQTSATVVVFIFISSNIAYIGYSYVVSALIGLVFSILVWKEFAPFLQISKSFVQVSKFKEIASMGSWLLVNQLGSILFLSIDLIIINYYFGAESTGEYSIVLQWSILLRSLAGMLASVLSPIILISYANKKFKDILNYTTSAVKFLGIIIAIPVGLLMGFSTSIISLWVGVEYIKLVPLLWLVVGHLAINLSVLPLFSINTAYNKVKIPGMMSFVFGLMNLLLAIILSVQFEFGLYGVALAGALILTVKNTIFTPLYAASILNINKFTFFKYIFFSAIVTAFSFICSYGLSKAVIIDSFFILTICLLFTFFLLSVVVWITMFSKEEKGIIINKLKRKSK